MCTCVNQCGTNEVVSGWYCSRTAALLLLPGLSRAASARPTTTFLTSNDLHPPHHRAPSPSSVGRLYIAALDIWTTTNTGAMAETVGFWIASSCQARTEKADSRPYISPNFTPRSLLCLHFPDGFVRCFAFHS